MILGSFVLFFFACLLLFVFPPAAFLAWLVSVVMFFVGISQRGTRKAIKRELRRDVLNPQLMRECPSCKEMMRRDASVCPHCRRESTPWIFHEGRWWVSDPSGKQYWLNEKNNDWVLHKS
jgi:hypothetical protein